MPRAKKKNEIKPVDSVQNTLAPSNSQTFLPANPLPKIEQQRQKIYITGATGKLGREVIKLITSAIPLVRKPSGLKNEIVSDFSVESLSKILSDADILIHLAGSVNTQNPKELQESNVELTKRIVNSLPEKTKVIFASSISVYGKYPKQNPANEETETNPDSDYSRSKLEAERIVRKRANCVILRIGTIYGPEFSDYFKVLQMIEKGKMKIIGNGNNHIPFVHVSDVALAISNSLGNATGTFVLVGEQKTQKEIFGIAAKELSVPEPKSSIPQSLALLTLQFRKLLSSKQSEFTAEHILVLSCERQFNYAKSRKDLSFSPRSIEEGIKEMVTCYKKLRL